MRWPALLWLALLPASPGAGAAGEAPSPESLLRAADASRHPIEEGVIRIHARVEEEGKDPVVSDLEVYVQGDKRALCVFRAGPLEGRKILTVDDRVWLLVPDTAHAIPISANQRLLGGASIADVARLRFETEFAATQRPESERVGDQVCYAFDLKAKAAKASYAGGTLWVGVADGLPRQARFTLPSGREAKEVRYAAYGRDRGGPILKRMEIAHLLPSERGMRTTLEFVAYESRALDPGLFDPAGARALP